MDVATAQGMKLVRGSQLVRMTAPSSDKSSSGLLCWSGISIPTEDECQHFLIAGKNSSGKSQAIYSALRTVAERGQPALVADPGGTYLSRFGKDDSQILNPFDYRLLKLNGLIEGTALNGYSVDEHHRIGIAIGFNQAAGSCAVGIVPDSGGDLQRAGVRGFQGSRNDNSAAIEGQSPACYVGIHDPTEIVSEVHAVATADAPLALEIEIKASRKTAYSRGYAVAGKIGDRESSFWRR
jgi:hypothetical protein